MVPYSLEPTHAYHMGIRSVFKLDQQLVLSLTDDSSALEPTTSYLRKKPPNTQAGYGWANSFAPQHIRKYETRKPVASSADYVGEPQEQSNSKDMPDLVISARRCISKIITNGFQRASLTSTRMNPPACCDIPELQTENNNVLLLQGSDIPMLGGIFLCVIVRDEFQAMRPEILIQNVRKPGNRSDSSCVQRARCRYCHISKGNTFNFSIVKEGSHFDQ